MNINLLITKNLLKYNRNNARKTINLIYNASWSQIIARNYSIVAANLTSKLIYLPQKGLDDVFTRRHCTESGPPADRLPPLMDFPKITWPSLMKGIKNVILATFIVKPYLDNDFSLSEFVIGSKKAVEVRDYIKAVVSKKVAEGDLKSLDGLVASDIIPTLQRAISTMSLSQREQIAVEVEDIYFSFPYQVGIMFNDEEDEKRFVEITMVYHVLKGLSIMRSRGEEPPLNMGLLPEYQGKISICNYRFIREYTKGVESDWTINMLNHFRPVDEVKELGEQ